MQKRFLILLLIIQSLTSYSSQSQPTLEVKIHSIDPIQDSYVTRPQQQCFQGSTSLRNPSLFIPFERVRSVTTYADENGYQKLSTIEQLKFFDECMQDQEMYQRSGFKKSLERQQLLEIADLDQTIPAMVEKYKVNSLKKHNEYIKYQKNISNLAVKIKGPLSKWRIAREKKLDELAMQYQRDLEQDFKDSDQEHAERNKMMLEEQLVIKVLKKEQEEKLKEVKKIKAMAVLLRKQQEISIIHQKKLLQQDEIKKKQAQSKADKEKHLLQLQELEQQKDKNTSSTLKKKSRRPKKKISKNLKEPMVDNDEEVLNQAITENQKRKDEEGIVLELDSILPIDTLLPGNQLPKISSEIQRYRQFVQLRSAKLAELEVKRKAQQKVNLEIINKTESVLRKAKQLELDQELERSFGYISSDEEDIDNLFTQYQQITSPICIQNTPLAVFKATEIVLKKLENPLAERGESLNWYLADHPMIYDLVKKNYISFKRLMSVVDTDKMKQLREDLNSSLKDTQSLSQADQGIIRAKLKNLMPAYKNISIFHILSYLHEVDGPLDITKLIYEPVSAELVDRKGILPSGFLQRARIDMEQNLKFSVTSRDLDLGKLVPITARIMRELGVEPSQELINTMVRHSFEVALAAKKMEDSEQMLQELQSSLFCNLRRDNEMSLEPKTEDQMADISRVHITVIRAILKTIQE